MHPSDWQYTPLTLPLLLIGLLCGWVAYVAWRRSAVPGAVPFAVLMTGIAGWTLFDLAEKSLVTHGPRYFFSTLSYLFIVATPGAWFAFAVRYSRYDHWLTRRRVGLLFLHPVLVISLALTDPWHGLLRADTRMTDDGRGMLITYGPLFWFHTAYTYLLFAAGAVFLLMGTARRPDATWPRRIALLAAMVIPTLGNVAYVFRWHPLLDYGDLTPVYFALTALVGAWTLFRVRLFDVLPLAREFILNCLADPVFVLDTRRRLLDVNAAGRAFLPIKPAPWRNRPLADVFPDLSRLLPAELPTQGLTTEVQLHALDPDRSWDMHVLPMLDHQVVVGTLVRLSDVTERKRAERERRALDERLRRVQKLQSLSVLAGGVAHDFNNLLTVILGNAELALNVLGPGAADLAPLRHILHAGNQAAGLARQMLTYAGKARFLPQPLSLHELIESMSGLFRSAIARQAELELDLGPNLPPLQGDPDQLRQLLLNLVTNASDALGEQAGTICIRTRQVEVNAEDLAAALENEGLTPGTHLSLEVNDTGAGMDAATLSQLFEPFFTTRFTGRGLGLAVVLGVVRAHGGAIFVASEPRVGTQVRVLFPTAPVPSALAPESPPPRTQIGPARGAGTVLLAEDEELVRDLAERLLQQAGFQVLAVENGAVAMQVYRAHAADIDVVLLDLTMPVLSGSEVFRQLRQLDPDLRIILMSGYDEDMVRGQLQGQVPTAFLRKPFCGEDLKACLCDVVARARH